MPQGKYCLIKPLVFSLGKVCMFSDLKLNNIAGVALQA